MPCPPQYGGAPVTNIRNVKSPHWRGWLGPESRCLVPFISFCEYQDTGVPKAKKVPTWFAVDESRPLIAFAGIWTPWTGVRSTKANPVESEHRLFGFLTTEPNEVVAPIDSKAMPVLLTTDEEFDWLRAPWKGACALRRPLPNESCGSWRAAKRTTAFRPYVDMDGSKPPDSPRLITNFDRTCLDERPGNQ